MRRPRHDHQRERAVRGDPRGIEHRLCSDQVAAARSGWSASITRTPGPATVDGTLLPAGTTTTLAMGFSPQRSTAARAIATEALPAETSTHDPPAAGAPLSTLTSDHPRSPPCTDRPHPARPASPFARGRHDLRTPVAAWCEFPVCSVTYEARRAYRMSQFPPPTPNLPQRPRPPRPVLVAGGCPRRVRRRTCICGRTVPGRFCRWGSSRWCSTRSG